MPDSKGVKLETKDNEKFSRCYKTRYASVEEQEVSREVRKSIELNKMKIQHNLRKVKQYEEEYLLYKMLTTERRESQIINLSFHLKNL